MQPATCPRCNMYLAPGAQVCPNCHLNIQQYLYSMQMQQQFAHVAPAADSETKQEGNYRKILMIAVIALMGESVLYRLNRWMGGNGGNMIDTTLNWLSTFFWAGFPLAVALILPKRNGARVALIVIGSLYAVWRICEMFYYQFFYDPYTYVNF